MKKTQQHRGFTLIELLVVIAIIGMLSSVVLASLTSARLKSRDARRSADMQQVQLALELYATDNGGSYPPHEAGTLRYLDKVIGLAPKYIAVIPQDPLWPTNSNDYRYLAQGVKGYVLLRRHEGNNSWCRIVYGSGLPGWWGNYPLCSSL